MKVAIYHNNNDIRLEERPIPVIKNGEILVKMKASGICGTDVMEWYRKRKAPRVLGHEMAGEIVAITEGAKGFNIGDRVFVSHHVPCFDCHWCLSGKYSACEALHSGNYDPGGFAEYVRIPAQNVKYGTYKLPENISYDEATIIEPLACTLAGQKRIGIGQGQSLLVIGSGISGLTHIMLAKLKGAKVIATDINEYRLEKALQFGADHIINANEYCVDELKNYNEGRLAEVVIVCTGADTAIRDAFLSVDRRGTVLFFAVSEKPIMLPSVGFWRDEISITFSYGAATDDIRETIEMISSEQIEICKLVTHKVSLSEIQRGFRLVSDANESIKIVVVPD
jgi:L-iditol 2-dehydrogenase